MVTDVRMCAPQVRQQGVLRERKQCEKKKCTKCYDIPAYCVNCYYYEYAKYCPTLTCDKLYVDSETSTKPEAYVAPECKLVKTEDGQRYDKYAHIFRALGGRVSELNGSQ